MKSTFFAILLLTSLCQIFAQDTEIDSHKITISSYVDSYFAGYSTDLNQDEFQPFITVGARDDSFGLNVAQLGLAYEDKDLRGHIVLHYGDIPKATWSGDFNMIQEANVGVRVAKGLWLDAGFFATHIGTESFLPKNNLLSSTAYVTYNEPFYQAGAKLSYDSIKYWTFELWAMNGYNNFVDNNDAKSLGTLVSYNFSKHTSLTYTNLYGRESEDGATLKQNRFYQNIFLNQNWNNKLLLTIGFDFGLQSNSDLDNTTKSATMYGGMIISRYQVTKKFSVTSRAEIFKDNNGFISGTFDDNHGDFKGLDIKGFTLGTEYKPSKNAYLRTEGRYTTAANDLKIFMTNGNPTNERFELLLTIGLKVEKLFSF